VRAASSRETSPYLARPWLTHFSDGAVARFRWTGSWYAVVVGVDPLTLLSSQAIAPLDFDELTIALFQDEYLKNLPFLPAAPMAYLSGALEIFCSVLVLIGLATRLAALPLLGITLFIQLFVPIFIRLFALLLVI